VISVRSARAFKALSIAARTQVFPSSCGPAAAAGKVAQRPAALITAEQWLQLQAGLRQLSISDRAFLQAFGFSGPRVIPAQRFQERPSPVVAVAMRLAAEAAYQWRCLTRATRPWVRWHPLCPTCGAAAVVRSVRGVTRLWLCVGRGVLGGLAAKAPARLPHLRRAGLLVAQPAHRELPSVRPSRPCQRG
jgi:hypothetical protein